MSLISSFDVERPRNANPNRLTVCDRRATFEQDAKLSVQDGLEKKDGELVL